MTQQLTPDSEARFIERFHFETPRYAISEDCRPAVRTLLSELKVVSEHLGLRLEIERLDDGQARQYPRIHGVIPVRLEPILWSLCAPANNATKKPENHKLEVLPHQGLHERDRKAARRVERLAKEAGFTFASTSDDAIPKIGITHKLTPKIAERAARALIAIDSIVRPIYS